MLLLVVMLATLAQLAHPQQQEAPPTGADDEYIAPNLGRSIGRAEAPGQEQQSTRRRYPDRTYADPGSDFRQPPPQPQPDGSSSGSFSYDPYPPPSDVSSFPTQNKSSSFSGPTTPAPVGRSAGFVPTTTPKSRAPSTRDPFSDPNRYRVPQQHEVREGVHFVNGRPYR